MRHGIFVLLMGVVVALGGCGKGKLNSLTAAASCADGVERLRSCLAQQPDCLELEPILWEACTAIQNGDDGAYAVAQCESDETAQEVYGFVGECELDQTTCACIVEGPPEGVAEQAVTVAREDGSDAELAAVELPSSYGYSYGYYYPTGYYYPCSTYGSCGYGYSSSYSYYYPSYAYTYPSPYYYSGRYNYVYSTYYTCTTCTTYTYGSSYYGSSAYYYPTSYYYHPTYSYYYYPSGYYYYY